MDIDIDVEDTDQIHPRGEKSRKETSTHNCKVSDVFGKTQSFQ